MKFGIYTPAGWLPPAGSFLSRQEAPQECGLREALTAASSRRRADVLVVRLPPAIDSLDSLRDAPPSLKPHSFLLSWRDKKEAPGGTQPTGGQSVKNHRSRRCHGIHMLCAYCTKEFVGNCAIRRISTFFLQTCHLSHSFSVYIGERTFEPKCGRSASM